MDIDRKAVRRQYKESARPAGLFAVRNTTDGAMLIGASAPDQRPVPLESRRPAAAAQLSE